MNTSPQVVILMHNTLAAMGVRHIINESFDVMAHQANSIDELEALPANGIDYVITDAQFYLENLNLFLPRKARTLVVVDRTIQNNDENNLIDSHLCLDELVATFSHYLGDHETTSRPSILSQRETDVLRLIASGLINKEIADRLNISINTVLTHRKNITSKLGIKSVSGLSFYAMMNGIIKPQ